MQHGQTLRQRTALFLQRAAVHRRVAAQQPEGDGVALQRFARTGRQQLQRTGVRGVDAQFIAAYGNQLLTFHLGNQRIDNRRQLLTLPAQEQLGFQHWVQSIDIVRNLPTGYLPMLGHNRRQQRRHNQHVRNVVAIVGHQYRLLARQNDDIADGIFLDFELVHLQRVIDKLAGRGFRCGRIRRVWRVTHQGQITIQLLR